MLLRVEAAALRVLLLVRSQVVACAGTIATGVATGPRPHGRRWIMLPLVEVLRLVLAGRARIPSRRAVLTRLAVRARIAAALALVGTCALARPVPSVGGHAQLEGRSESEPAGVAPTLLRLVVVGMLLGLVALLVVLMAVVRLLVLLVHATAPSVVGGLPALVLVLLPATSPGAPVILMRVRVSAVRPRIRPIRAAPIVRRATSSLRWRVAIVLVLLVLANMLVTRHAVHTAAMRTAVAARLVRATAATLGVVASAVARGRRGRASEALSQALRGHASHLLLLLVLGGVVPHVLGHGCLLLRLDGVLCGCSRPQRRPPPDAALARGAICVTVRCVGSVHVHAVP
mmetsp:Transcript_8585/g.25324  ORF Transcript_8585/g.25324 Transcript_8585/m.25324 type:complete len:344 (+) Transcript_8585:348-1379(+)